MLEQHIAEEAGEFYSAARWSDPDVPGSARVLSLAERVNSPEEFVAFRKSEEGRYLLNVIDAFEDAMNDDWMPFEIVGLPLQKARLFIHEVCEQLQKNDMANAVVNLRRRYVELSSS